MELAIDNTQKLQTSKIETTLEVRFRLFEKYFDFNVSEHINLLNYKEETSYVLSNKNIILGAVCMLYKDTLRDFANSIESDFIIVLTNVDVIYVFNGKGSYDYYKNILKESNCFNKTVNCNGNK